MPARCLAGRCIEGSVKVLLVCLPQVQLAAQSGELDGGRTAKRVALAIDHTVSLRLLGFLGLCVGEVVQRSLEQRYLVIILLGQWMTPPGHPRMCRGR
ncbi:hypothetical protein D3C71_2012370 [compost metagenome]